MGATAHKHHLQEPRGHCRMLLPAVVRPSCEEAVAKQLCRSHPCADLDLRQDQQRFKAPCWRSLGHLRVDLGTLMT